MRNFELQWVGRCPFMRVLGSLAAPLRCWFFGKLRLGVSTRA